jgi:pimeloyl-ACP methyl ester carboxylesterase
MRRQLLCLVLTTCTFFQSAMADPGSAVALSPANGAQHVEIDTPASTPAGTTFMIPGGWTMTMKGRVVVLSPPEPDLTFALIDVEAKDADAAVAAGWAAFDPGFKRPLWTSEPYPPPGFGWDEHIYFGYEVSPSEKLMVNAYAWRAGKNWLVEMLQTSEATEEKRDGPFRLAMSSVRPKGYKPASPADETPGVIDSPAYTRAQHLVEVERGRRLNLYCTGKGSPTVVFDAGLDDVTATWALVQPVIAAHTQACSYDRAGFGFSDPGRRAGDSANIVDDLHRLLVAASIKPPYVLVGHSFGGMNVRLYADTYPTDVVGMVLVDSAEEDWMENLWKLGRKQQTFEQFQAAYDNQWDSQRECVKAAASGFVEGTDLYKHCVHEPDPTFSKAINAAYLKVFLSPAYQQALLSEDENIRTASADQVRAARRWFGAMPLIVLTSSPRKPGPSETPEYRAALNRLNAVLADQFAALSSRGVVRPVPNSTHTIQMTQPGAVNDAILEVLGEASQQK